MMRVLGLCAAIVVVIGACERDREQRSPNTGVIRATADSLRDDLVENGLVVPSTRDSVATKFGAADSIRTRPQQNRHNTAQTDSIVELFYPGIQLTYYIVGESRKEFLTTAQVWDNRYLKYPQLGVGASVSAIMDALGPPFERTLNRYEYGCARCLGGESPLYFHVRGNVVTSLEYSFYLD